MLEDVELREATSSDVPAMVHCRQRDGEDADSRMTAYLEGRHHPHEALLPRVAFAAFSGADVVGYIAGHRTRRFGYDGEVQYLYVGSAYRRQGIASALLKMLAGWFAREGIERVCVNVNVDSLAAAPFYRSRGAAPLNRYWYGWEKL